MKKKAYVIGTNVNKSLSPTIFQYWFKKYNIDGEYGYIEIEEKRFDKEIFSLLNTRSDLVGLNITIPYKEKIIPHLKEILTPHPKNIGSINFIWSVKKNIWFGDYSDFIGFIHYNLYELLLHEFLFLFLLLKLYELIYGNRE